MIATKNGVYRNWFGGGWAEKTLRKYFRKGPCRQIKRFENIFVMVRAGREKKINFCVPRGPPPHRGRRRTGAPAARKNWEEPSCPVRPSVRPGFYTGASLLHILIDDNKWNIAYWKYPKTKTSVGSIASEKLNFINFESLHTCHFQLETLNVTSLLRAW